MTPPEFSSEDVELRDALSALMPAGLEMPAERIHSRVVQLRKRSALRMTAAVAAGAVAVAIAVSLLPSGAARGRVRVEAATTVPHRRGGSTPTTASVVVTTTTTHGRHAFVPASTPTVPNSVPPETSTTMAPIAAPPTTTAPTPTSQPSQPNRPSTPTTVAPAPTPAPVTVTLILDNAGLHVPTTQVAAGYVAIIFRDQRTDKSNGFGGTLVPEVHITPTDSNAPAVIVRAWWDDDLYGHFGAAATFWHLEGPVSFQLFNTVNHASAGPLVWTTFTAS